MFRCRRPYVGPCIIHALFINSVVWWGTWIIRSYDNVDSPSLCFQNNRSYNPWFRIHRIRIGSFSDTRGVVLHTDGEVPRRTETTDMDVGSPLPRPLLRLPFRKNAYLLEVTRQKSEVKEFESRLTYRGESGVGGRVFRWSTRGAVTNRSL